MTDFVFPEDTGTGAGQGDDNDAANFGAAYDGIGLTDFVVQGLGFTLNAGTPSLDLGSGKVVVSDSSATATQSGETRSEGVAFVVELDARTGISLTDGAVNHVFLQVDLSSDDTVNIVVNTTDTAPSEPQVKLGTVDTSADTTTELNRDVPVSLSELDSQSHSELTGIGSSDHHSRYSDEEAQDAVGTILSAEFNYDDAGDLIDLSSDSVTVAGNSVSLGGSTNVDYIDLSDTGSSFPIPNTDLLNSSLTVAGNTVSLGGSTSVNHSDISGIGSSDHHVKTSSASELTDVSADSVSGAHHSKTSSASELTDVSADTNTDAHHTKTNSASEITDVSPDSVSGAHHSKTSSASELTDVSADTVTDAHHVKFTDTDARNAVTGNVEVDNLNGNNGTSGQFLQTNGSNLSFTEVSGGLDRISDLEGLVSFKQSFNSIRNRDDWIDYILQNNKDMADEITNSQVLTHYLFESENDKYDRFIDPNHNLGLFAYNNNSEPNLSSVYEAAMFLAPTSFLEGLLTKQSVADTITNSATLMDAVHNGDEIMENNFGFEAGA